MVPDIETDEAFGPYPGCHARGRSSRLYDDAAFDLTKIPSWQCIHAFCQRAPTDDDRGRHDQVLQRGCG